MGVAKDPKLRAMFLRHIKCPDQRYVALAQIAGKAREAEAFANRGQQEQHAAGAIDNRVILHMLLEPPECGEIRESTATQQELVLAQTLWRFRYRPIGKI